VIPSQPPPSFSPVSSNDPVAGNAPWASQSITAQSAVTTRSRGGVLAVVGLGIVAVLGVVSVLAIDNKESAASRMAAPHAVASEPRPLAGEPRTRDVPARAADSSTSSPAASGPASTTATSRGVHAAPRPPASHPISDEPGKKPPRPNPYASASPPH
jgi:hypothetical protein